MQGIAAFEDQEMADKAYELSAAPIVRHVADILRCLALRALLFLPAQQWAGIIGKRI